MNSESNKLINSMTPEQLEKTRANVHEKIQNKEKNEFKEDNRIDKLDLISDVQLIVVGKFQGMVRLVWTMILLGVIILSAQVFQFSRELDLHKKISAIAKSQQDLVGEQKKAVRVAEENIQRVTEVKEEVKRTKEQVKEAVEASPKIEIDPDSGKAKVVVPVKHPKGNKKPDKKSGDSQVPTSSPLPPPPSRSSAPPVPVPTQVELRMKFY